jgi:predicted TIM-barrel fold metal-dependent hydrolase
MKKNGIDKSIIHMIDMDYAFGANTLMSFKDQLQFYIELNQEPEFISFLGIDLRRDDHDVLEVFKLAANHKCGVKLYPPLGFNIENYVDKFYWALANEAKTPVTVHGSKGGIGKNSKYSHPSNLLDLLFKYPEFHLCVAHGGGEFTRWTKILENWFMDFPYLVIDTAFHSDVIYKNEWYVKNLNSFVDRYPTKVLLGTDFSIFLAFYGFTKFIKEIKKGLKKNPTYEFNRYDCISSYNPEMFLEGIL